MMGLTMKATVVVLLILLVVPCTKAAVISSNFLENPLNPNENWYGEEGRDHVYIVFDPNESQGSRPYVHSLSRIMNWLRGGCAVPLVDVYCVLERQNLGGRPQLLVLLEMHGRGGNVILLSIRSDNLYISGIANRRGRWHEFPNRPQLIRPSSRLRFTDSYRSLLGVAGHENIVDLRFSRDAILDAVDTLSTYEIPGGNTHDDGYVRRAVATLAVAISEALRFPHIFDKIRINWQRGVCLTENDVRPIVHWSDMSCVAILSFKGNGWVTFPQNGDVFAVVQEQLGLYRPWDNLKRLDAILWPNRCNGQSVDRYLQRY